MGNNQLFVSAPIAGFRVAQAREYWESYPCPPPSTVYGMLLSLVGERDRHAHIGAEIAIAIASEPARSTVLRTVWRFKETKSGLGLGNNRRPEFQELLSHISLSVWVRRGAREAATPALNDRISQAIEMPSSISRFGALCLGESTHLVDELREWRTELDPLEGNLLIQDRHGSLSLPIWPDHIGSRATRLGQFRTTRQSIQLEPPDIAWTAIMPLDSVEIVPN